MALSIGEMVNQRYRVVKLLGQGGFGAVYRAWDTNLDEPVALKESFETSAAAQKQFQLEAKLLFRLVHSNLPRVHDYFVIPGKGLYLVMDFIEGQDLETLLQQNPSGLPVSQISEWIGQVCGALEYLHSQDPPVIHRDLKPANIRITPQGRAILVDFGIAKVFDAQLKTTTGARALTPGFAPIEQYGQGVTDARTDLYALGATLYTLATGQRPLESVQRTIQDALTPAETLNPDLSPAMAATIRRAMQMDPGLRFQSAAEFKRALSSPQPFPATVAAVGPTVVAPLQASEMRLPAAKPPQTASRMHWGWLAGAGALLLGVIGIGIVAILFAVFSNNFGQKTAPTDIPAVATGVDDPTVAVQETPPALPSSVPLATRADFAPDIPADIPLMPEAVDVKTTEYTEPKMLVVYFTVDATEAQIIAYYEREMPGLGWNKSGVFEDARSKMVYFQKDERVAMVAIYQTGDKMHVSISIVQNQ
jgi:hypothetical protein